MNYIDLHCDTLSEQYGTQDPTLVHNSCAVDFAKLTDGGCMAQFFAIWLPPEAEWEKRFQNTVTEEEYLECLAARLKEETGRSQDRIRFASSWKELEKNRQDNRMSAVLTIEDGRSVRGKVDNLKRFYDMGVRLITLTWNYENCFGYPNSYDPDVMGRGLKPFGLEAVEYMNELGMIVDVSHLSEGGFYDVASVCRKPFIASHSNARELSPNKRNLSDEMIRIVAEKGGVIGLNICAGFLNADVNDRRSRIADMSRHARHIADVGGMECLALGTDFDGTGGDLELDRADKVPLLWDQLIKDGFTLSQVEKIAWKNALRAVKDIWSE